ncbi:N-acetylmuramoyl-L-alanine amidase [Virgibacillus necropolis]|uniref:N-acetylmuramoyl-L-alanine amidase n=1 Tax=Virgibacillus necropolis TaxID=163877 RepID=A0A221ME47_9BACI|nr:N-acetylmuramoyl-L-alanine amidase [Virgibacillus necropolis]ASN05958.1 N-acetylmuramoyl-L-alanine amidase [Virgibacillus necropolis]
MKPLLIIDPGHGGKDPGGGSNRFWKEKDLNLKISLYQYNRYKQLGIPVSLTRQSDVTLTPEVRTRIVRNSGATFCHSNHINAGGGDGAEIIHSIYGGKEMSSKIAAEMKAAGQNIRRVFTRKLPVNSNLDFYFMNRNTGTVTTSIIEYGFADSKKDDIRQLQTQWETYAEAVVKGFCLFTGNDYFLPSVKDEKLQAKSAKILRLPESAGSWRVYPLDRSPVKGNEKGFLRPSKFNGLEYKVLGSPLKHVYTITTRDFGKVNIYAHPETGATFK